jgi:UDP-N-acetyl-2-amino-2-deoxyglucuronate dehydrogenase
MGKIGVGVVGCGLNGRRHAELYNAMEEVDLIGCCDTVPDVAGRVARKHGVKAFTRVEDLVNDPAIDAVSIVTPANAHCEPAVIAAKSGKHILAELPMAISLEECDRMIDAADTNGVNLMYAQVNRFMPANAKAKTLIDGGEIGNVVWITHTRMGPNGWGKPRPDRWSRWRKSGGGFTIYEGPHYFDDFRWLSNSDFDTVYSVGMRCNVSGGDGEDNAIGGFKLKSGGFGVLLEGTSNPGARRDDYRIVGTKGMIEIIDPEINPILRIAKETSHSRGEWETIDTLYSDAKPIEGFDRIDNELSYYYWVSELREFINSIEENRQPACTGYDGRVSLEAALALRLSEETGMPVKLPLKTT